MINRPENRRPGSACDQILGGRHIYRPRSVQGQLPFCKQVTENDC